MSLGPIDMQAIFAKMNDSVSEQDTLKKKAEKQQEKVADRLRQQELLHDTTTNSVEEDPNDLKLRNDEENRKEEAVFHAKKGNAKGDPTEEIEPKSLIKPSYLGGKIDIKR